ncbi:DUF1684 domain-containing protein [Pseudoxanthomonas sp. CAU 1598]|uniref:DUF1684 domain-containing protein n=2 Tax=Pseudomarimonas arenosa TaxID=2774145 RepID=A0AAW3ZQB0_9GAMM|nr:DUF1684 domain-containing protein [Pseudomarimonas arenosa]
MSVGCAGPQPQESEYRASIKKWHAQRAERLMRPEGWLSLVGLHWIEPGRWTLGSDEGSDIVLATGPGKLGVIERQGDEVWFSPSPDAGISIDGGAAAERILLAADVSGAPTVVRFNDGAASFVLIERSGKLGLRVRDANAPTRTGFIGIDHFPVDSGWRYEAKFTPHPPGKTIEIASVINTLEPMVNSGVIEFEREGKPYRLEVIDEGDGALFVIFADRTNGKSTYGAGRFLYAESIDPGHVVVDFNKAYNPPCALNSYSTCPLPPPENRLDLAIDAGEKNYLGPH